MADTYKRLSDTEVEVTSTRVQNVKKEKIQEQIDMCDQEIAMITKRKKDLEDILPEFNKKEIGPWKSE